MSLPAGTSAAEALDRVLRLPSVCSKRFLTTKVGAGALKPCCQEVLHQAYVGICAGMHVRRVRAEFHAWHGSVLPPPTQVDRCVTGLIAQQQCCGPLQLPISDVAVMAQTHFGYTGAATAIGEQPLKVGRRLTGVS